MLCRVQKLCSVGIIAMLCLNKKSAMRGLSTHSTIVRRLRFSRRSESLVDEFVGYSQAFDIDEGL